MKWLLILFVGIIIVPTFAQNDGINQTEYQKLTDSINKIQTEYQEFNNSINLLQINEKNLNSTIVGLHNDHVQYDQLERGYAVLAFLASGIIAIIFFWVGSKQTDKIQTITDDIRSLTQQISDMVTKQDKLIVDLRDVYASAFVMWIQQATFSFEFVIDLYNNQYLNQPITQDRENVRTTIKEHYDKDLIQLRPKVETVKLVEIFGKEIADRVFLSTTHLYANEWQPYSDEGMKLMIVDYKKRMKQAVELRNVFLPYCDLLTRELDQKYQEIYDKIKSMS